MSHVLETRAVSFKVESKYLVHEATLHTDAGEVVAVVGPNGAGKSTLLRLVAGELSPTEGEVYVDGRSLSSMNAAELAIRRAVLPQQTVIEFSFKAEDIVLMGRNPHLHGRWAGDEDRAKAIAAMERTESLPFRARTYPSLSGGEQSRVTMARVLAQEVPLLLLDEPTSSLDIRYQELVMRTARELAAAGACLFVIVHDLNLAAAYADRIIVMKQGAIVADGTPSCVLNAALLSSVFDCELRVIETDALPYPLVLPERPSITPR